MKALGLVGARAPTGFTTSFHEPKQKRLRNNPFCVSCSSSSKTVQEQAKTVVLKSEYKPGVFDDFFLNLFRNKLVQEVGWDSQKPGYDGLIEVVNRLMKMGKTNSDTIEAAVRVLRALFPPFLLELYKIFIAPLGRGKIAAMMVARVTALTCQWLMGPCKVNSVELPDGTLCSSGVFVERCKYLEESKCVGICINTCKFPTQTFFKDHMGVPLLMEPNFADYSCQFKFGVLASPHEDDSVLKEPCLEICPNAAKRRTVARNIDVTTCPKT
ncbi:hypothetical protein HN51_054428 [Arachis hypogaea]|uniref:Beta-carotene isomerase D27 n=1 Tax=Arachis hypogaea TaxID=3818 RepID=A0A444XHP0_ARAHY|nr:beta-carotene isomerase D27, chloroplastic [Arachis ipaensis]XP_025676809.1 beta-carotene isomerase D27, chloroplastic [Arachis hypogaea]QHN76989.1 Beta-carotene isomerase D27 [Arachis hypogaea]RYQ89308.1 hypothetical protein Ahy_B09g096022 [Arachis hypogaea]